MREQVAPTNSLDGGNLLYQDSRCSEGKRDRILLVVSYHPALGEFKGIIIRLQNMIGASEGRKSVF